MVKLVIKHWKKMALLATFGIALLAAAFVVTKDHWWKTVGSARVFYNGQSSTRSSVYKSENGDLLVVLSDEPEGSLYIFHPQSGKIGMPNRSSFILLPGIAYSKIVPPPAPLMESAKIEVDPDLIIQPQLIEFNSFNQGRVRVTW